MFPMHKILLIIHREYFSRVRKKSFIVMTILGPLLMAGFISLAVWLTLKETETHEVLVVDEYGIVSGQLQGNENIAFSYSSKKLPEVLKDFERSPFTLLVFIPENIVYGNAIEMHYRKYPGYMTQRYISSQIEKALDEKKLETFNLDKSTYDRIRTTLVVKTIDIKQTESDRYKKELMMVGLFFAVLIYMFIFIYGVQVMRGVIEEKTSRIVEVIISSVKPFQLMMGKIVGIALVGLTQFILWVVLTFVLIIATQSLLFNKYSSENIIPQQMTTQLMQQSANKPQLSLESNEVWDFISRINFTLMIGLFLFYFLFGYLLYASLFAAVGAAVDNEADTQQFMFPITLPLIFGFIVAELAIQNPEGSSALWFSIIPFTSPVVMMVRVASGLAYSDMWQLYLSMFLLAVTFIAATWVAGRVYRTGILMYGKKAGYAEIWKWLKY